MGGDWYEGIIIDEHRYALILGDVAGHGITAVGDMAQLRAVIGALVRLGTPMEEVFTQASRTLELAPHHPTASSVLVIVDTAAHRLTYAVAGHPPPVVRTPSRDPLLLEDGRQPILGIGVEGVTIADHPFPPGSLLVAYTDGLIERRGQSIDVSLERLVANVADAPDDASAAADHLLEASLHDHEPDDDVALIVVAHLPAPDQGRRSSSTRSTSSS
jgi:serine phosphatase RsbU (regulator of sigma subunit)